MSNTIRLQPMTVTPRRPSSSFAARNRAAVFRDELDRDMLQSFRLNRPRTHPVGPAHGARIMGALLGFRLDPPARLRLREQADAATPARHARRADARLTLLRNVYANLRTPPGAFDPGYNASPLD